MRRLFLAFLLFAALFYLMYEVFGYQTDKQKLPASTFYELVKADRDSLTTMNIRQLMSSLNDVKKEMSSLTKPSAELASKNNELYTKKSNEYEKRLKLLKDLAINLQKQIDMKEKELELSAQKKRVSKNSLE